MVHLCATTLTICDRHESIFWKRVPDTLPSHQTTQRRPILFLVQRGQCLDLALVLCHDAYTPVQDIKLWHLSMTMNHSCIPVYTYVSSFPLLLLCPDTMSIACNR